MSNDIAIIGGGFTGLSAAYDLARAGKKVTIYESDSALGGLAGSFEVAPGCFLEKFYHHWFTSDVDILNLVRDLKLDQYLESKPTNTGLYYANSIFRLTSPFDLLKFTPISFFSRIRTGLMVLKARRIESWKELEDQSAEEWIIKSCGREAYETVWRPLLDGKFGPEASAISAVWFWNKLKLRGSSRGKSGNEELFYISGGFKRLVEGLHGALNELGVRIHLNTPVTEITSDKVVRSKLDEEKFSNILVTTPVPIFLDLIKSLPEDYREQLSKIRYLGNICLILGLDRSLSSTYWLNIADPKFPFVGVIEHTNFDSTANYGGKHIVYLSKYLPTSDPRYSFSNEELLRYSVPHITRMFPGFSESWINSYFVWREQFSQPVITKRYSTLIPPFKTPVPGVFLSTMAQIYPEDRGTSYAVRGGREAARELLKLLW